MTFKKFDEYENNDLHGEENFRLKVIPLEDIDKIKVVTKTYKIDEQETKEAAAGAGAGILYYLACLLTLGAACK